MSTKIAGFALLFSGLLTIALAALSVYNVFINNAPPISLFNEKITFDLSSLLPQNLIDSSAIGGQKLGGQSELIPSETLNKTANLALHLFLMGFFATIGQKVAQLGVELLRPVNITIGKEKLEASS